MRVNQDELRDQVREYLSENKMTGADFGRLVKYGSVWNWLHGRHNLSEQVRARIIGAVGKPVNENAIKRSVEQLQAADGHLKLAQDELKELRGFLSRGIGEVSSLLRYLENMKGAEK